MNRLNVSLGGFIFFSIFVVVMGYLCCFGCF